MKYNIVLQQRAQKEGYRQPNTNIFCLDD